MKFLWPEMLWLLTLLIVTVLAYVTLIRRRSGRWSPYPGLKMESGDPTAHRHRASYLAPLILLVGLALMLIAIARPTAVLTLPSRSETIVLAIDVSNSMRAGDVKPNRFEAAKKAIEEFLARRPSGSRVGLVAFASTAAVVQAPTANHSDVKAAMKRLQLQNGTAVGSAILVALHAIFPELQLNMGSEDLTPAPAGQRNPDGSPNDTFKVPEAEKPVEPGSYRSAAIVLLTDGQVTTGADPMKAAETAAARGVRVYTVGVGTTEGHVLSHDGWSARVYLDEDVLKKIARKTGGEYFIASDEKELAEVYKKVGAKLSWETKETEVTALFTAAAACFALLSAALSVLRYNRIA